MIRKIQNYPSLYVYLSRGGLPMVGLSDVDELKSNVNDALDPSLKVESIQHG